MKKIKKIDSTAAQSVVVFACPCAGSCQTCFCHCRESYNYYQDGHQGAYSALSTISQHGLQKANYY